MGRLTTKVDRLPSSDSHQTCPPSCSMIDRTRSRPVPGSGCRRDYCIAVVEMLPPSRGASGTARWVCRCIDVGSATAYRRGMKSVVSTKGQVTLPAEVRAKLGLTVGTAVQFELREGGVLLRCSTRCEVPGRRARRLDGGRPAFGEDGGRLVRPAGRPRGRFPLRCAVAAAPCAPPMTAAHSWRARVVWPDGYGARVGEGRTESAGASSRPFSWALTPRSRRTPFSRGTVASIAGTSVSR